MEAGKPRMARFGERFSYMFGDFADGVLPPNVVEAGPYDLVVSARAIHHLPAELMASLYARRASTARSTRAARSSTSTPRRRRRACATRCGARGAATRTSAAPRGAPHP